VVSLKEVEMEKKLYKSEMTTKSDLYRYLVL